MNKYLKTKSIQDILKDADSSEKTSLKRTLGPWSLMALGIGAIVGAGIFVITGSAASQFAGPALVISFLIASIGCAFSALCYSEFASFIPIAGSAYTYGYASLGEILAWIIGWDLILEYSFAAASIVSGWSNYLVSLLEDYGIFLPPQITSAPGTKMIFFENRWHELNNVLPALQQSGIDPASLPQAQGICNLIAFLFILFITALLVKGIKESATFNALAVLVKLSIIFIFIGAAAYYILGHWQEALANWTPFIPENTGEFGHFGWSGIARGAGVIFYAYLGFDAVSTAAQEARDPQKDMPRGILGALLVSTILYVLVTLALTGVINYQNLNVAAPVAEGINATGVSWGILLVKLGAVTGLTTGMLVAIMAQARIFFAMSRDGLLPGWLGAVHTKFRTPWVATIISGLAAATLSAVLPISVMGELVSIGTLFAFAIVCAGVWILRRQSPDAPRPFRTPWVPFVPIMGILVSGFMMISLPAITWMRLALWLAIGMAIYFCYGVKHSHVQKQAQENAETFSAEPEA